MVFFNDIWHILGFPWFSPPDIITLLFYIKSKQLLGFSRFSPVFPTWNLNSMVFYLDFWHILGFSWFSPPYIITLCCFILSQSNFWVFPSFPHQKSKIYGVLYWFFALFGFPCFILVFPTRNQNFVAFWMNFWLYLGFPQFSPPEILISWYFILVFCIFWVFPTWYHNPILLYASRILNIFFFIILEARA